MALVIKHTPVRGDKTLTGSTYAYIDSDGALQTGV